MNKLILTFLLFPIMLSAQMAHYDSLYRVGAIDKAEYELLVNPKPVDSIQLKLDKYYTLYGTHQITSDEYFKLKEGLGRVKITQPDLYGMIYRARAGTSTAAGAIFLVIGAALAGIGVGLHVNNHGVTTTSAITGSFGGLGLLTGICLLAHGGNLRKMAAKFDHDQIIVR